VFHPSCRVSCLSCTIIWWVCSCLLPTEKKIRKTVATPTLVCRICSLDYVRSSFSWWTSLSRLVYSPPTCSSHQRRVDRNSPNTTKPHSAVPGVWVHVSWRTYSCPLDYTIDDTSGKDRCGMCNSRNTYVDSTLLHVYPCSRHIPA